MPKIDLLPCPFCGSNNITIFKSKCIDWLFAAECIKCNVSTGFYVNEKFAAETWNTRVSGWIPCSERLPGRFDTVLIAILSKNGYGEPAYYVTIGGMKNGNEFESYTGNICECETVTHWMPLPAMPEVINNVV